MTKSLPSTPTLRYLKEEAKDILKAHKSGNASCCETLRHLRQFRGKADEDILKVAVGLQETQFALALEYNFRNWTELKRFVEFVIGTGAKTEEELNVAAFRECHAAVDRGEVAGYLVTPDGLLHYDDETILHDEARRSWGYTDPSLEFKHTIESIKARGDKIEARVTARCVDKRKAAEKQETRYAGTWRMESGRIAESWIPQNRPTVENENAPPNTRPAISWLDRHVVQSGSNNEIAYVGGLLHHMAEVSLPSLTLTEDEPLPEIKDLKTGDAIATTFEHIREWFIGKTHGQKDFYVQHNEKCFIVHLALAEEPRRQCRIRVGEYTPGPKASHSLWL